VVAAVAYAVTTRPRDLLRALQHLRVPDPLVVIAGSMVRYTDVVLAQGPGKVEGPRDLLSYYC
jgi:cobalt/nickel transport system permease protein